MDRHALIRRIEAALAEGWLRQASVIEGAETRDFDGITVVLTNIPFPPLNSAFVTRVPEDPADVIDRAASWTGERDQVLSIDVPAAEYPSIETACRERGMREIESRPGMVARAAEVPTVAPPEGTQVRRVDDPADLVGFRAVQCEAFEMPRDVVERFVPDGVLGIEGTRSYVAVQDGEVVGTAVGSEVNGAVGIFGVAVLERARRRGLGAALTAICVNDAAESPELAWLQASEVGFGMYESLGFRTVTDWTVWGGESSGA